MLQYLKRGSITVPQINQRRLFSVVGSNVTQLINNASIPGWNGEILKVDQNGDQVIKLSVKNYRKFTISSKVSPVLDLPVGQIDVESKQVVFRQVNGQYMYSFMANKTAPPPSPVIPVIMFDAKMPMRYAFDAIVGLCSLFTLILGAYMVANQQYKIFKASSPRFLYLIIAGANISFISIWIFSQYPMNDQSCITYGWLKYMGFAVVFGALIVKTYRISVIFTQKKTKVKNLTDGMMFVYFVVFMACWVAILVIWSVVESQRPLLAVDSVAQVAKNGTITSFYNTPHCDFNSYK
jgi:hypothetical protein